MEMQRELFIIILKTQKFFQEIYVLIFLDINHSVLFGLKINSVTDRLFHQFLFYMLHQLVKQKFCHHLPDR